MKISVLMYNKKFIEKQKAVRERSGQPCIDIGNNIRDNYSSINISKILIAQELITEPGPKIAAAPA